MVRMLYWLPVLATLTELGFANYRTYIRTSHDVHILHQLIWEFGHWHCISNEIRLLGADFYSSFLAVLV